MGCRLAIDVVDYSRLMAANETGAIERQKSHRTALIDPKTARYGGRPCANLVQPRPIRMRLKSGCRNPAAQHR